MKTVIVYAHPYENSFNHAVLESIKEGLVENDERYTVFDLVKDGFNPVMTAKDLAGYNKGHTDDEIIIKYQEEIESAHKLIFIFPIWWGGMPAILKGFFDKVFLKNFCYKIENGKVVGLLDHIKKTFVFTTSGRDTSTIVNKWGDPIGTTLPKSTLSVVGLNDYDWINFDRISKSKKDDRIKYLKKVKDLIINY